ncbi:MAG: hypothetical protein IJG86_02015 [Clostridia bacterium]|nr:hypothetical protein [Clostridia bacterium]
MNKRLLAGMMAGALLLGGAASADVDLSGMSYDELVALQADVISAIAESGGAVSFRAEPGEYIVGEDIPVGRYSVRAAGDDFCVISVDNADGLMRVNESFEESSRPGKVIGQLILEYGERVSVRSGALLFASPAGISFN